MLPARTTRCLALCLLFQATLAAPPAGAQQALRVPHDHGAQVLARWLTASGRGQLDPADPRPRVTELLHGLQSIDTAAAAALRRELSARTLHGQVGAGFGHTQGLVTTGRFDLERRWIAPRERSRRSGPSGRTWALLTLQERAAVHLDASGEAGAWRVQELTLEVDARDVSLWLGRKRPGSAPGRGGSLVLNPHVAVDGMGIGTARPQRVPVLGVVRAAAFFARIDSSGLVRAPWLVGARVHARPHARFDFGISRAAVFGGMGDARTGLRELLEVAVGANLAGDHADDQVAALDARWRPHLPLTPEFYGEWGVHDADLAVLFDVPAFTAGVRAPFAAGAWRGVAALEHTRIARACCGNPPWYHHYELANGWTERGEVLGHPLGGHGHEWRVGADVALPARSTFAAVTVLTRRRGSANLFAPVRLGNAVGIEGVLHARLTERVRAHAAATIERGHDWTQSVLRLELSAHR